jgi:hypothetical protein
MRDHDPQTEKPLGPCEFCGVYPNSFDGCECVPCPGCGWWPWNCECEPCRCGGTIGDGGDCSDQDCEEWQTTEAMEVDR